MRSPFCVLCGKLFGHFGKGMSTIKFRGGRAHYHCYQACKDRETQSRQNTIKRPYLIERWHERIRGEINNVSM